MHNAHFEKTAVSPHNLDSTVEVWQPTSVRSMTDVPPILIAPLLTIRNPEIVTSVASTVPGDSLTTSMKVAVTPVAEILPELTTSAMNTDCDLVAVMSPALVMPRTSRVPVVSTVRGAADEPRAPTRSKRGHEYQLFMY